PDQPSGVMAELTEDEGDHRGGRALAVRTGDDDRVTQADELGEEIGPRASGNARVGGRDDDLPPLAQDRLGRQLDRNPVERREVGRVDAVPTADVGTPGARELSVG